MGDARVTHEQLLRLVRRLPGDYAPWGEVDRAAAWDRGEVAGDCSCCTRFARLDPEDAGGADWGVCTSLGSHRSGLLTFEHQGCLTGYEGEDDDG